MMGENDIEESVPAGKTPDKDDVQKKIEEVEKEFEKAEQKGTEAKDAFDILTGAKLMFDQGMYLYADGMADHASELVKKAILQYDLLVSRVRGARKILEQVKEAGGDPEDAGGMLDKAQDCLEIGLYKRGLSYIVKCRDLARNEIGKRDSWRVELDSWKE